MNDKITSLAHQSNAINGYDEIKVRFKASALSRAVVQDLYMKEGVS